MINFSSINAQSDTVKNKGNKLFTSVTAGFNIPVGKFSKYEYNSDKPNSNSTNIVGRAKTGFYSKLDFMFQIDKTVGLIAIAYTSINKADSLTHAELFPYGNPGHFGGSSITSYSYTSKTWNTNGLLIGLYISKNNKSGSFNFRIATGVQQVISPKTEFDYNGYNYSYYPATIVTAYISKEYQPKLYCYTIALNIGIDYNFYVTKKLRIKTGLDEFISQPYFSGNKTYTNDYDNGNGIISHTESQNGFSFTKNINVLCFNIGASYIIK